MSFINTCTMSRSKLMFIHLSHFFQHYRLVILYTYHTYFHFSLVVFIQISRLNVLFKYLRLYFTLLFIKYGNCYHLGLQIKVLSIFRLYKKKTICLILHQFNLYILLISGKKLVTIEIFLSSHLKP